MKGTAVRTKPYIYQPIAKRRSAMQPDNQTDARQTDLHESSHHRPSWLRFVALGMGLLLLFLVIWNVFIASWLEDVLDNWQYGSSRTFQMDAVVGHEDSPTHPTHLIAFDLHSQVTVVEIPGGDTSHTRVYTGLTILEGGREQRVITLTMDDVNSDGKPDLVIHIEGMSNTPILFNTGSAFSWTDK